MGRTGFLILFLPFFMIPLVVGPLSAGEPTEKIKQTTEKLVAILSDEALKAPEKREEKKKMIREVVDERFDWEAFSRRSLGRHWKKMTEEEKKTFVSLFGEILEKAYMARVGDYSGEKMSFEEEIVDGKYALVLAKIMTEKYGEIPVKYRVRKRGDNWLIYDISVQGVSLVNNYRSQFNNILMKSSPQELIKRLQEKLEKG
ncbi:ABC transporter substrate-binding protein [bacterium]|nr:ABC transporter substrate-binding protein [bacterium]